MPRFLKRLCFSNIAEQFEERTLGYRYENFEAAIRRGWVPNLAEFGIETPS